MDVKIYDAQADSIDVDDIATDSNNRIVMRRIKRNHANDAKNDVLWIQNHHDEYDEDCEDYWPEGVDDMGWLGYFIGRNEHLHELNIRPFEPTSGASVRDVIVPFLRGVSRNKSIREIDFNGVDQLGGEIFTILTPFFQNNHNLTKVIINSCVVWGDEGERLFALALGSSTHKSLQEFDIRGNNISEEGMVDIITALSMFPHLQHLYLDRNRISKNGCVALATLLRCSAKELQRLFISRTDIGDV